MAASKVPNIHDKSNSTTPTRSKSPAADTLMSDGLASLASCPPACRDSRSGRGRGSFAVMDLLRGFRIEKRQRGAGRQPPGKHGKPGAADRRQRGEVDPMQRWTVVERAGALKS